MSKKRILIPYSYNPNWIGGTYYIQNLLNSISCLEESSQYEFHIYSDRNSFLGLKSKLNISIKHLNYGFFQKVLNKIYKKVLKTDKSYLHSRFDVVFPYNLSRMQRLSDNRICWIPDFQERFLPEFFSKEELIAREKVQDQIVSDESHLVFSSESAAKDFRTFYPKSKINTYILKFATFHDTKTLPNFEKMKQKYQLEKKYFICSNQFWAHKNHKLLVQAISRVTNENIEFVFTGKEHDYRAPGYYEELTTLIRNLKLESKIKLLGFIDREDQLTLMKNSIAVIQPSLFEGWSTVIEDAKCLQKQVICSNLDVHKEQLGEKGLYFNKNNPEELAEILDHEISSFSFKIDYSYENAQKNFGKKFLEIIEKVS